MTSVAESDVSACTLEGPIKPRPKRTAHPPTLEATARQARRLPRHSEAKAGPTQIFADLTKFMLLAVYATFHRKASQKRPYLCDFRALCIERHKSESWKRKAQG